MNSKTLKIGKKVATISVEGEFANAEIPTLKVTAVYALLGGYNQVARKVDLPTFQKIQKRFNDAVSDMAYELKQTK